MLVHRARMQACMGGSLQSQHSKHSNPGLSYPLFQCKDTKHVFQVRHASHIEQTFESPAAPSWSPASSAACCASDSSNTRCCSRPKAAWHAARSPTSRVGRGGAARLQARGNSERGWGGGPWQCRVSAAGLLGAAWGPSRYVPRAEVRCSMHQGSSDGPSAAQTGGGVPTCLLCEAATLDRPLTLFEREANCDPGKRKCQKQLPARSQRGCCLFSLCGQSQAHCSIPLA